MNLQVPFVAGTSGSKGNDMILEYNYRVSPAGIAARSRSAAPHFGSSANTSVAAPSSSLRSVDWTRLAVKGPNPPVGIRGDPRGMADPPGRPHCTCGLGTSPSRLHGVVPGPSTAQTIEVSTGRESARGWCRRRRRLVPARRRTTDQGSAPRRLDRDHSRALRPSARS
jgi:hypothetical protein